MSTGDWRLFPIQQMILLQSANEQALLEDQVEIISWIERIILIRLSKEHPRNNHLSSSVFPRIDYSEDRTFALRKQKVHDDPTASKFYSTKFESYENEDKNEKAKDQQGNICKFINRRSPLTSHAYGWWYEQGIRPTESRIDFRKKTSDLVNYQMKIYAEDQKLNKNSKH